MPDDEGPERPSGRAMDEVGDALEELSNQLRTFETADVVVSTRRSAGTGAGQAAWERAEVLIRRAHHRCAVVGQELERARTTGPDSGEWPTRTRTEVRSLARMVEAALLLARVFTEGKALREEYEPLRLRVDELSEHFAPGTDDPSEPRPWRERQRNEWDRSARDFLGTAEDINRAPPDAPPPEGRPPRGGLEQAPQEPDSHPISGDLPPGQRSEVGAGIVKVSPAPRLSPEDQSPEVPTTDTRALRRHERVGAYEVQHVMARTGQSLLYLARHHELGHQCVLKGLRDPTDPDAQEAAKNEQRILASISDPRVVKVYGIVEHETSPDDRRARERYIVMAYVQGIDLERLRARRGGTLPAAEAIAYIHGIMPALSHLHRRDLVHSDIKPGNIMHSSDDMMQLIDLGAARLVGNDEPPRFGTIGYHAPEDRASVGADLYSAGRTLAALILGADWVRRQPDGPPSDEAPIRRHDCLHRFLQRACAPVEADNGEAASRFADADEMAEALYGVMCQVAATDGRSRPHTSDRWRPPQATLDHPSWDQLPLPELPRQPLVPSQLASAPTSDPEAVIKQASGLQNRLSWSDLATLAHAHCRRGRYDDADQAARRLNGEPREPAGQRTGTDSFLRAMGLYLRGQIASARGDHDKAVTHFNKAYDLAPGEPACALALAVASEAADEPDWAKVQELYSQVAVTDQNWVVAIAGKARALSQLRKAKEAADALEQVPATHPLRSDALKRACLILQTRTAAPGHRCLQDMIAPWADGQRGPDGDYSQKIAEAASLCLPAEPPSRSLTVPQAELAVALFTMALAARERPVAGAEPRAPVGWVKDMGVGLELALVQSLEALAKMTPYTELQDLLLDAAARTRPWGVLK